jgi:hypothetical protein
MGIIKEMSNDDVSPASNAKTDTAQEPLNNETNDVARTIAMQMMLHDLEQFSKQNFFTPQIIEYIRDEAERFVTLIDEDKSDTQANDALKAKIKVYMVQIEKKGELYYRIEKLIKKNKLSEAAALVNLKSSQDFILEFEHDDTDLYPLLEHSISITDTKPADVLESKLKEYQKQLCINDEDTQKAQRISTFLHTNLNTADKIQRLNRLDEMFVKIDRVYKQPIALDNLETSDAQQLLIDSIRCNCKELMIQIISHPKHQSLINQTFTVEEPRFLHPDKNDFNDYTPLTYAQKEMRDDLAQLLIQHGAKDENKQ